MREHDREHPIGSGRVGGKFAAPLAGAVGVNIDLPEDLVALDLNATEIALAIRVIVFRKGRERRDGLQYRLLRSGGQGIDTAGFDDHSREIAGAHACAEQVVQDRDMLGGCDGGAHDAPPV